MVVIVPVAVYPQRTSDAADDTAGHPADNTPHDPADRSESTMASTGPFVRPFARALSDALSLRRERHGKKG
jgi:hypothetical protein